MVIPSPSGPRSTQNLPEIYQIDWNILPLQCRYPNR
jgi:hypothetical protein